MVAEKALTVYDAFIRSEKGPKITENVWDNNVIPVTAVDLKEKYEIDFGDNFIPTDQDLKERLFRAGVEMLVTVGILNVDTRPRHYG